MTDYESMEDFHATNRNPVGLALTFLCIGLGAGAIIALLFAPKAGKQLRRDLRRKYEDARDTIGEWSDQANDVINKGAEWASAAKEKVAPLGKAIRKS